MYADYVVWGGGMGGLVDDFFNWDPQDPSTRRGKFSGRGNQTAQSNI